MIARERKMTDRGRIESFLQCIVDDFDDYFIFYFLSHTRNVINEGPDRITNEAYTV